MQIYHFPTKEEWPGILQRPVADLSSLDKDVRKILDRVKKKGDKAVFKYTKKFDKAHLAGLEVSADEITDAIAQVPDTLQQAIKLAAANIETFHRMHTEAPEWTVTMPGILCARKSVAIEKVGLYIPGGTAPLFSTVLMLGIPARLAGCREVILCSPPDEFGRLHPAILFAAHLTGITRIFKAGGVQAIAAMAYGTESIPAVYKIFGPGNQYVMHAKQVVQQQGIAIDMPAGPSEVCVLADESAEPVFVAADLLSQAEHGTDSQVLLVTTSERVFQETLNELERQVRELSRKEIAQKALQGSRVALVKNMEEAIALCNAYAPEHLILACEACEKIAERIINAGSVFMGNYSPEAAGDYASGTNHTLPTNGYAKAYSGVSVDSFVKKITYQKLSEEGLRNIGDAVMEMAKAEGLDGHAKAIEVRMNRSLGQ
ncbi:MAG TPA: histidinol dehydrogenase [Chitinophagaceae bacterium]|nr:histidinol dehydrogenase [Chitinophagaceae bacterium]